MTLWSDCDIINLAGDAAVAQSVVRRIGSAEVTGPIPVSSLLLKSGIPYKTGIPLFAFFGKVVRFGTVLMIVYKRIYAKCKA